MSFVTVRVVDKDGNLCPDAQHLIKYSVKGAGTYRAGANGDPTSIELFHLPQMKVFNGMMTAIVQSTDKPGEITLTATGKGLKSGKLVLMSKYSHLFRFPLSVPRLFLLSGAFYIKIVRK